LKTGIITTVLGTGQAGDGPEPNPLECKLSRPHAVLFANGVLYVADSEAHHHLAASWSPNLHPVRQPQSATTLA